jgi:hypothetical protein
MRPNVDRLEPVTEVGRRLVDLAETTRREYRRECASYRDAIVRARRRPSTDRRPSMVGPA